MENKIIGNCVGCGKYDSLNMNSLCLGCQENNKRTELIEKMNEFDEETILKVFNEFDAGSLSNQMDGIIGQMSNEDLEEFVKKLKEEKTTIITRSKIHSLFNELDRYEKEKVAEELNDIARESL